MSFVLIMMVFIVSYGVASHALRYPHEEASWATLKDIIYLPYWSLYGELNLDLVEGESRRMISLCINTVVCPQFIAHFLEVVYIFVLVFVFVYTESLLPVDYTSVINHT